MDRRVQTFLPVAECGSFSEAARKLFITQPAVTQQIASLGDELGVRLFERDGNRMVLTTPGRVAQGHYLRMREEEQSLKHELAPWSARRSFTVGCPSGMIAYDEVRYSQVLQAAMRFFPDADVRSCELDSPAQHFRILADHEADVIISGVEPMEAEHGDAVRCRTLRAIRHYVVCRRDDALAEQPLVELGDLAGRVVYTFESEAFPDELLRRLAELGDPKPALRRQQSLAGALPLIQAGRGVTVYAQEIPLPQDLTLVPLDFAPNAHVGLVWLKDSRVQARPFKGFVEEVAQMYLPEREQEKAMRRRQMRKARAAMSADKRARQSEAMCARLLEMPQICEARVIACYLAQEDELDLGAFMRVFMRSVSELDEGQADGGADARGATQASPRTIALPVTLHGPQLAFLRVSAAELADPALLPRCLREPARPLDAVPAELADRLVDPADIDVAVLPGLAFDARCTRLGHGGGYYDAWLGGAYGTGSARHARKATKPAGSGAGTISRAAQHDSRRAAHRPLLIGACFDCQLLPPEATLPREPHDVAMDAVVSAGQMTMRG